MPPAIGTVLFHGYIYGAAFWYSLRGVCRVYDPDMVIGWFRPPAHAHLKNNDLERYNVRTDAWCLITLAGLLVSLTKAIPATITGAPVSRAALAGKPYAKAAISLTMFHHVATAFGSYGHYKRDSHYNKSMGIGVWANAFLTTVGGATLYYIW